MHRTATLCLAALALACAAPVHEAPVQQAPAPRAAFDPAGIYDFTTDVQGTQVGGTLTLSRTAEGGFTGTIWSDMTGDLPLQHVDVEGRRARLRAATPEGELVMDVEFEEDRMAGNWELATGLTGAVAGRKRSP
ncbi:MAG TPA: hypothetical protein VK936_05760 [Longimicrobiales bacterium]|nr:hypothetical protein [Longimicrobiales bacterium]